MVIAKNKMENIIKSKRWIYPYIKPEEIQNCSEDEENQAEIVDRIEEIRAFSEKVCDVGRNTSNFSFVKFKIIFSEKYNFSEETLLILYNYGMTATRQASANKLDSEPFARPGDESR